MVSSKCSLECLNVLINHWARVNDRNVAVADDVGSGAVKSEARGFRAVTRLTRGDTVWIVAYSNSY